MKQVVEQIYKDSIKIKEEAFQQNMDLIVEAAETIIQCFQNDGKLFFMGNGGSAADSQHIAAEFIGRFQHERRALPAMALTTDTSILTAIGNDYTYDIVFARQLEGLGRKADVAFGISTSGNSKNVIEGLKKAKELGIKTVALTGNDGGQMASLADISIVVPSKVTARIQESHLCIAHSICELVENQFLA